MLNMVDKKHAVCYNCSNMVGNKACYLCSVHYHAPRKRL